MFCGDMNDVLVVVVVVVVYMVWIERMVVLVGNGRLN